MSFLLDLVKELNAIRTKPKDYAAKVRKYKEYFKGNILRIPGSNIGIKTNEGPNAYEEAATFLDSAKPLEPLEPSKGLMKIAGNFLEMIQKTDPSKLGTIDMESIIEKFGSFTGNFSRALEFGGGSPEQVVMNLTVSDGDKSRGQRNTIFNENLKKVGVANGTHDTYRHCTVIVSCTKFKNNVDADDSETFDGQFSMNNPSAEISLGSTEKSPEKPKPAPEQPKPEPEKPKPAPEQPKPEPEKPKPAPEQPKPEPEKPKITLEQPKPAQNEPPKEVPLGTHKEEDVVSEDRQEKIILEHGKRKKLVTITKKMKDGTIEKQTLKENLK